METPRAITTPWKSCRFTGGKASARSRTRSATTSAFRSALLPLLFSPLSTRLAKVTPTRTTRSSFSLSLSPFPLFRRFSPRDHNCGNLRGSLFSKSRCSFSLLRLRLILRVYRGTAALKVASRTQCNLPKIRRIRTDPKDICSKGSTKGFQGYSPG